MRFLIAVFVLPVVAGCGSAPGAPDSAAKSELAPSGTLRIAVFTGNPVIGVRDKAANEVRGTTALLGTELAARAGVSSTLIEYTSVAKMVEDAKANAWDVAAAEMTIVLPKGRAAALDYVGAFVADAKRSGSVARAIESSGLRGVSVAP